MYREKQRTTLTFSVYFIYIIYTEKISFKRSSAAIPGSPKSPDTNIVIQFTAIVTPMYPPIKLTAISIKSPKRLFNKNLNSFFIGPRNIPIKTPAAITPRIIKRNLPYSSI